MPLTLSNMEKFFCALMASAKRSRPATDLSASRAKKLIAVGESKADASLDPGDLAGWTMLVNELLNLDEVLNK